MFLGRFHADGSAVKERALTGFALYVKQQYSVTKAQNSATPHKDIMKMLSGGWSAKKNNGTGVQAETIAEETHTTHTTVSQAQMDLESQMGALSFE